MNRADEMLAARVEAMQRDLAGVISADQNSNQKLYVDPEDLKRARQREKRRGSRRFLRFLVAICLGIASTLAWQAYGDEIKQIIATRAPDLGWSPESRQMIASSIEWIGWTRTPAGPETAATQSVAPKAPTTPSLDPAQMQQIVQNLASLREMLQQLSAGQEQTTREIGKLESAVVEILMKMPEPQSPAAPARKPAIAPAPSSRPATPPKP
jgi:hypothetical protein